MVYFLLCKFRAWWRLKGVDDGCDRSFLEYRETKLASFDNLIVIPFVLTRNALLVFKQRRSSYRRLNFAVPVELISDGAAWKKDWEAMLGMDLDLPSAVSTEFDPMLVQGNLISVLIGDWLSRCVQLVLYI